MPVANFLWTGGPEGFSDQHLHCQHPVQESSAHRLQRGLPGYLILFAPRAFASQRQVL